MVGLAGRLEISTLLNDSLASLSFIFIPLYLLFGLGGHSYLPRTLGEPRRVDRGGYCLHARALGEWGQCLR